MSKQPRPKTLEQAQSCGWLLGCPGRRLPSSIVRLGKRERERENQHALSGLENETFEALQRAW